MELNINLNQLESYLIGELKGALNKASEEFFNTFDRSISKIMEKLQNAINCKFINDIDLSYYTYYDIQNLIMSLSKEIINFMDSKLNDKNVFEYTVKLVNNENSQERGNLKSIEEMVLLNKYNIEINFNKTNKLHQLIKTLMHEFRHVYQWEYELFNMMEDKKNFDYIDQPHEVDAREYVDNNFEEFTKLISAKIYPMFSTFEIR